VMVRESVSLGILILVWVIRSIFKGQSLSATEKLPLLGQKEIFVHVLPFQVSVPSGSNLAGDRDPQSGD
jgi:hypothetical protein